MKTFGGFAKVTKRLGSVWVNIYNDVPILIIRQSFRNLQGQFYAGAKMSGGLNEYIIYKTADNINIEHTYSFC